MDKLQQPQRKTKNNVLQERNRKEATCTTLQGTDYSLHPLMVLSQVEEPPNHEGDLATQAAYMTANMEGIWQIIIRFFILRVSRECEVLEEGVVLPRLEFPVT